MADSGALADRIRRGLPAERAKEPLGRPLTPGWRSDSVRHRRSVPLRPVRAVPVEVGRADVEVRQLAERRGHHIRSRSATVRSLTTLPVFRVVAGSKSRVSPGQVADQSAVRPGVAVEQERQVGGERHAAHLRDEQAEAVPLDEGVEFVGAGLGEGGRDVHRRAPACVSGPAFSFGTSLTHQVRSGPAVYDSVHGFPEKPCKNPAGPG